MAESISAPARGGKKGQAPGLTDDQKKALFLYHLDNCRKQNAALETAMEAVRAVRKLRNRIRHEAHGDGFPLKKIDEILFKEGLSQKDLEVEAELFHWMDKAAGVPVGGQLELFAKTPVETKDALDWEAEGFRAGLRGHDATLPEAVPPRFHQSWLKGRMKGQEELAWGLSEAGHIVDRRADLGAGGSVQLQPEPEAGEQDASDPKVAAKQARKLKEAGFMDTKAGGQAEDGEQGDDASRVQALAGGVAQEQQQPEPAAA